MKKPVQIFKSTVHAYSDVYASKERASYTIGRPDGARAACFNISEREAHEILANLPEELKPEGADLDHLTDEQLDSIKLKYGLVSAEAVEEEVSDGAMGPKQFEKLKEDETGEDIPGIPDKPYEDMGVRELREVMKVLDVEGRTNITKKDDILKAIYKKTDEILDGEPS